jgi:tetratricopeptide (TPR) repeat protein
MEWAMAAVAELYDLALRMQQNGDFLQAESLYTQILRADPPTSQRPFGTPHPGLARVHYNLGNILQGQRRLDEAVASYRQAVRIDPAHAWAHNNLGIALKELSQFQEAVDSFRQAIAVKPRYVDSHYNLGVCLMESGRLQEAVAGFTQALALNPSHVAARCNLGMTFKRLGHFDDALIEFIRALDLEPGQPMAAWSRSLLYLMHGDFAEGWKEYEYRQRQPDYPRRAFDQPFWNGSSLDGKTILIHVDGGLGDTIQFIRYAPMLKKRGASVVFECPATLERLLKSVAGIDRLTVRGSPLPPCDVHAPLMSLPRLCGTTLATIPGDTPYLEACPQRIAHWRQELAMIDGFKIGIAWQGNPKFGEEPYRSIPLRHFEALAALPNVRLISLQKGPGSEQLLAGFDLIDWANRLDLAGAFTDSAAIMTKLDLIVTSDTSIAHLAGALGVPVWTVLSFVPEWRWLLDRSDSPWYPTMRLFRQSCLGDWEEVMKRVAEDVQQSSRHTPRAVHSSLQSRNPS